LNVNVLSIPAPTLLDIPATITVTVSDTLCFDLLAQDTMNFNDTLSILPYSNTFDFAGTFVQPQYNSLTSEYYYDDFNDSIGYTVSMIDFFNVGNVYSAVGDVALRFCWVVGCDDAYIQEFDFNYMAFSTVCSSDTISDSSYIYVDITPAPVSLDIPDSVILAMDSSYCIYFLAMDTVNALDTLAIEINSTNGFDFQNTFVQPQYNSNTNEYYYNDFNNIPGNVLSMSGYSDSGYVFTAVNTVGLKFCWTVGCFDVQTENYDISYMASSTICGSDSVFDTSHIVIDIPITAKQEIPNVFTPNGDNILGGLDEYNLGNDYYRLTPYDPQSIPNTTSNTNSPTIMFKDVCYDSMEVLKIFNRWGQLVFESTDPYFQWDGTDLSGSDCGSGSYLVIIKGSYGRTLNPDPVTGDLIPIENEYFNDDPDFPDKQYWIQLIRD